MWLKVAFRQTWFCANATFTDAQARAQAETWASNFGPGFATGLLTLQSDSTIFRRAGTLYVSAPDNVTPDTFGFLAANWSRDCIDVTKISPVDSPPDAESEQSDVDNSNPSWYDKLGKELASLGRLVVGLMIALIVVFVLIQFELVKFKGSERFRVVKRRRNGRK